jgi:signal transduction histidine kinase
VDAQHLADGLAQISESALRMADQLTELVAASRSDPTQRPMLDVRPTDLGALARQVAEEAQQATERHRILVELPDQPVLGDWDGGRLARVLANLLSNAAKYSPRGGDIVLRVTTDADSEGRPRVVIAVQDHGIGIPASEQALVFEPFRRARNGARVASGSGIGLASVRQIVEQHGGTVQVESREGEGSTFTVSLPRSSLGVGPARIPEPARSTDA